MQKIIHGDCLEEMQKMESNSISCIVTDPPYGLGFMGKHWDAGLPHEKIWKEALRIVKPGGFLLAFGGSRTHHRLTCSIEDAGWEIRDCIQWIYGSGFPKSMDISKSIDKSKGLEREIIGRKEGERYKYDFNSDFNEEDKTSRLGRGDAGILTIANSDLAKKFDGYGTALKPAYEPIIMAMKSCDGTFKENAEKWGQAGINIEECRIGVIGASKRSNQSDYPKNEDGTEDRSQHWARIGHDVIKMDKGRWPANVIFDEKSVELLDQQSGINASRFFYCAKASSSEKNEGIEGMPLKAVFDNENGSLGTNIGSKSGLRQNNHPTVKPIKLMEYLIKLVMPPKDGVLLDPFAGSGSTIVAAKRLGVSAIGIEKEKEYYEIANGRVEHAEFEPQQLEFKVG